ncbi:MAG: SdrD B-like domain-containing protein [Bacteroidota bacterium]
MNRSRLLWRSSAAILGFVLAAAILAVPPSLHAQCVPPPPGMIAWWPADNHAQDIINGNNGTPVNGAGYAAGKVLQAFSLFGGGFVLVPHNSTLNVGTGDFSFEAWVHLSTSPLTRVMLDKRGITGGTWGYEFYIYQGRPGVQIGDGTSTNYNANPADHAAIDDNTWHHVAVTVTRSSPTGILFYIDGQQLATPANPTAHPGSLNNTNSLKMGIGADAGGPLNGYLDEAALYNRALSPSEVLNVYLADSLGRCKSGINIGMNHYKTWRLMPTMLNQMVVVEDQFMTDSLRLTMLELLSNPVQKIHEPDTFNITEPDHHFTWYRAMGRDTMLSLTYVNQFESRDVSIGPAEYLLLPARKMPHFEPESLDHYKAYRILDPSGFRPFIILRDQFDTQYGMPEYIDSLRAVYFLTPAIKNMEASRMFDSVTHYVAYEIMPKRFFSTSRGVQDQFGTHSVMVQESQYLLVPSEKILPAPAPLDTGKNHFKTWMVAPQQFNNVVHVRDQFMQDSLALTTLQFLSNPVMKIHQGDTSGIVDPDDHLTWYHAMGRDTLITLEYTNQFGTTAAEIGMAQFLLVPAQKAGHGPSDSLDHYKAYTILNPVTLSVPLLLRDQFDTQYGPEAVDSIRPVFFLTPALKNMEQTFLFDSVTHYVAYEVFPKRYLTQQLLVGATDQFGSRTLEVLNSQFLLVPSLKTLPGPQLGSIGGSKFDDQDGDGQWDPLEPGLAGWTINLAGPVNGVAVTGAGGVYSFNNLPAGAYTVSEVLQAGWTQTAPPPPGTWAVNLLPGQAVPSIDFGNQLVQVPPDTGKNHFKTWQVLPQGIDRMVHVRDQFMQDSIHLMSLEFLSNPVMKIHQGDTSGIVDPDDHLTWYHAMGRDTLISLEYSNQFGTAAAEIGMVRFLLVPATKAGHGPWDSLDHYKAYEIQNPAVLPIPLLLRDQFDTQYGFEAVDSIRPVYFLTPALKNMEQGMLFDSVTHYVAYLIYPQRFLMPPLEVGTTDQFGSRTLTVERSAFLLVPSLKILPGPQLGSICGSKFDDQDGDGQWDPLEPGLAGWTINLAGPVNTSVLTGAGGGYCFNNLPAGAYTVSEVLQAGWTQTAPPPPGTWAVNLLPGQAVPSIDFGNQFVQVPPDSHLNHFKTWMVAPQQFNKVVHVRDQFMQDSLALSALQFLSNPVMKIHQGDTSGIVDPDDHLTWYHATGRDTLINLEYTNQFGTEGAEIGMVQFLLVPATKAGHGQVDSLDHYKAYAILNPVTLSVPLLLRDQFDVQYGPEAVDSIRPVFFLTPALKNMEQGMLFDSVTHYVAYELFPKRYLTQQLLVGVTDQFGSRTVEVLHSQFLLVPSLKTLLGPQLGSICGSKYNDTDGDGQWDIGEPGLAGWTINLAGPVNTSVVTGAGGSYCFNNLPAGAYTVSEVLQAGWTRTAPPPPGTYAVNLLAGQTVVARDFGNSFTAGYDCPPWLRRLEGKKEGMGFKIRTDAKFMTRNLAVGDTGDVCVCGYSNVYGTKYDYVTERYNRSGGLVWSRRYNNWAANKDDKAYALTMDDLGNVYVTGESRGGSTKMDILTVKYSAAGDSLWSARYTSADPGRDAGYAIALDDGGTIVYVTGETYGGQLSGPDLITLAYNASTGAQLGVQTYNGPGSSIDKGYAIDVDPSGFPAVAGESNGGNTQADYVIVRYNAALAGVPVWTNRYDFALLKDYAFAVGTDAAGTVYVTGASEAADTKFDYATLAYTPAGAPLWGAPARFNKKGKKDYAYDLVLDGAGSVYVTGASDSAGLDYATLKYNAATGAAVWASENRYDSGIRKKDIARGITFCAAEGKLFVTGSSDQGKGRKLDYVTLRIDAATGTSDWVGRYNGPGVKNDIAYNVVARPGDCCVVITGTSVGAVSKMDWATMQGPSGSALPGPVTSPAIYDGEDEEEEEWEEDPEGEEEEETGGTASRYRLRQCYPNPFNPVTTIGFRMPEDAVVTLTVYNMLGQAVAVLLDGEEVEEGVEEVEFNAGDLASGVYFYRLTARSLEEDGSAFTGVKKMVLLK